MLQELDPSIQVQTANLDCLKNDHSSLSGEVPQAVIWPKTHDECVTVMQWANQTKTPIVVRGAGSGTTGGALAAESNVVLCLDKMNHIIDLDVANATITVAPGVILKDIHTTAESKGLFYPPDPASLNQCSIGGNIAENAGGPRALKYGVTRDYVIGLAGVWANGEPFRYGGKLKKNVAGYDLIGLLVGSEGTLGVVTEITLKLIPKPPVTMEALSTFQSAEAALQALSAVMQAGIHPATAEFMVDTCVDASLAYMGEDAQFTKAKAYIVWQVDGTTNDDVFEQLMQVQLLSQGLGWCPMDTAAMSEHVWSIRRNVSLGLRQLAGKKFSEDIVVPVAAVPAVIQELEQLTHACGIQVLGYGHLGDGNIHVNILKMSASDADWDAYASDVIAEVMAIAIRHGGSISGEHGIGLTKKQFMPLMFSTNDMAIMKNIKAAVDPNGILNPGKVFD